MLLVLVALLGALGAALAVTASFSACAPEFRPEGFLTVEGLDLSPTACRVLTDCTGIELRDAASTRLRLTMPPTRVDTFEEASGPATATLTRASGETVELGDCGTLRLEGQGYHGQGKRAMSGTVRLDCGGGATSGELTFTGCF